MPAAISFTSAGVRLSCQEIMGRSICPVASRNIPQHRCAEMETEAISAGATPDFAMASRADRIVASTRRLASCSTQLGRGYVQGYSV